MIANRADRASGAAARGPAPGATADAAGDTSALEARAWEVLAQVEDPEIQALNIVELGIVRHVRDGASGLVVGLSPTYSGCPATDVIAARVREALRAAGFGAFRLETVLSPPWSSDDLTAAGREKLRAAGIAPPQYAAAHPRAQLGPRDGAPCPRCGSPRTRLTSEFGSTPCKALYKCEGCLEPFEYFKCI